jgi:hypothetical protein
VPSLIEIPDVRQRSDYGCGDAAVDAALGALGISRKRGTRLSNPVQGIAPDTVAAVLRAAGCVVLAGPMPGTVGDLKHFTASGCPVLCPVANHGGHWVVVRGVQRGRVYYHCPLDGPLSRPGGEWLAHWHDTSAEGGHAFACWGVVVGTGGPVEVGRA